MKKLAQILAEASRPTYSGPPLEKGGTSIQGKETRGITVAIQMGLIKPGMRVLDLGAGKYSRNTKYLVAQGVKAIAVDPHNHNKEHGVLKDIPPKAHFDVAFTSYVLNVVPENVEDEILQKAMSLSDAQFHITRADDLVQFLAQIQINKENLTRKWIIENVVGLPKSVKAFGAGRATKDDLIKLAQFGFATFSASAAPKGFQRLPQLGEKGFKAKKVSSGCWLFYK